VSDGSIRAWGNDASGQCTVPALPPATSCVALSAGADHTLALLSDGSVSAWGANYVGQCSVPTPPAGLRFVEIAAGSFHSVARCDDGSVHAWGDDSHGQCNVPALPPGQGYVQIAAGAEHTLARRTDGTIVAWGNNQDGQCNVPVLPAGLTYVDVAAGLYHSAARRSDGVVLRWGHCGYDACEAPSEPAGFSYVQLAAGGTLCVGSYVGCPTCAAPLCLGDGSFGSVPCPCANSGLPGRGCDNSFMTGGAHLVLSGIVNPVTIVLSVSGTPPSVFGVFLQGSALLGAPIVFGDGLRCIGGALKRLAVKGASGGAASYPQAGDASISARSAELGDPIAHGSYRYYQVYYRDSDPAFCNPLPANFNMSNGVTIAW
jgi:hypothetical protein